MEGKIIRLELGIGLAFVETDGGITMMELLGGYEPAIGDVVRGDLESLGGGTVRNVTQSETMDVMIEDCHMTRQQVAAYLRQRGR